MAKKSATSESLESIIETINKQFGAGSIMRLDETDIVPVEVIPTGILPLDMALGVGGLPKGRIVEMYGPPSSGKSTLSLHCISEAQAQGLTCAYIDVEHAFDPIYAEAIGVNVRSLIFAQPNNAEQALEMAIRLINSGEIAVVVIDSVAALVPRAELEGEMGDAHVGLQPRIMGQALRKITGAASKNDTIVIFINQLRESIGKIYGPSEYTPGGKSLGYASSIRLDIRRIQTIKKGDEATANRTRVKVVKNKVAPPFKEAEFDLEYGVGVPKANALLDCAIDFGILQSRGAWIYYDGEQFANGRAKAKSRIEENQELYDEIDKRVRAFASKFTAKEANNDDE
jgi:recombination protein RecA